MKVFEKVIEVFTHRNGHIQPKPPEVEQAEKRLKELQQRLKLLQAEDDIRERRSR